MKLTKLYFLVMIFLSFLCSNVNGQMEIKLYTGVMDRLGLGAEYAINDKTGIEVGGSFRSKASDNFFINAQVDNKENNIYINAKIKRYVANQFANHGIFYGAFLRYWQNYKTVTGMESWTVEQKTYAENNNGWISTKVHKTSLGVIFGYKGKISESFSWEISFGAGASPSFLYVEHEINSQDTIYRKVSNESTIGFLRHANLLTHLSFGYRF